MESPKLHFLGYGSWVFSPLLHHLLPLALSFMNYSFISRMLSLGISQSVPFKYMRQFSTGLAVPTG